MKKIVLFLLIVFGCPLLASNALNVHLGGSVQAAGPEVTLSNGIWEIDVASGSDANIFNTEITLTSATGEPSNQNVVLVADIEVTLGAYKLQIEGNSQSETLDNRYGKIMLTGLGSFSASPQGSVYPLVLTLYLQGDTTIERHSDMIISAMYQS